MKFICLYGLNEAKMTDDYAAQHWAKHRAEFVSDPRFDDCVTEDDCVKKYNEIADNLSSKKVEKSTDLDSRYVGYVSKNNINIKYDTETKDFIAYRKNIVTTLHKKDKKAYLRILKRDFKREFSYNQ